MLVKKKGFSTLELLLVILLLSILTITIVKALGSNIVFETKAVKLKESIKTLKKAVMYFYRDTGYFPQKVSELWLNKDANNKVIPNWAGPYIKPGRIKDGKLVFEDYLIDFECVNGRGGKLSIEVQNIPIRLAEVFDEKFDNGDLNSGKVEYRLSAQDLKIELFTAKNVETGNIYCR